MPHATGKRFSLGDVMALVALAGLCVWIGRHGFASQVEDTVVSLPKYGWSPFVVMLHAARLARYAAPCAALASLFVVAAALRPPRPAFRRLLRRPGVVACLMVVLLLGLNLPMGLAVAPRLLPEDTPDKLADRWLLLGLPTVDAFSIGAAVAAAWLLQAASGTWRPEPTWVDRAGRLLGLYWLTLIPAAVLIYEYG